MHALRRHMLVGLFCAAFTLAVAFACTGGDGGGGGGKTASRLEVMLTDAPANYDNVWVTMDDLDVHRTGGGWVSIPLTNQTKDSNSDGDDDVIANPDGTVTADLLALQGVETLFASGPIDPGKYTGMRLKVLSAEAVEGGQTIPLKVPSGAQSGVKINAKFTVDPGQVVTVVLDFDAAESIHERGNSGKPPILEPVIKADARTLIQATIPTGDEPVYAEWSPNGDWIAVANAGDETVVLIDTTTFQIAATFNMGIAPCILTWTPSGDHVLVANTGTPKQPGDTIVPIDVGQMTKLPAVQVGSLPSAIGVVPDGSAAYVLARSGVTPCWTVIDLGSFQPVATISTDAPPHSVAFSDDSQVAVVTTMAGQSIYTYDAQTHKEIHPPEPGLPVPSGVKFIPGTHTAVVANADLGPTFLFWDADIGQGTPSQTAAGACTSIEVARLPGGVVEVHALTNEGDQLRVLQYDLNDLSNELSRRGAILGAAHPPDITPAPTGQLLQLTQLGGADAMVFGTEDGNLGIWGTGGTSVTNHLRVGANLESLTLNPTGPQAAVISDELLKIVNLDVLPPGEILVPFDLPIPPLILTEINIPGDTCRGNIVLLVDDGLNNATTSLVQRSNSTDGGGNQIYWSITNNAVQRFYGQVPDIYDYVVVMYASEWRTMNDPTTSNPINIWPETGGAFHSWTRNFTTGIGDDWVPGSRFGNRAGTLTPAIPSNRLQSRLNMNDLGDVGPGPDFAWTMLTGRSAVGVFAQEIGHRWSAFASLPAGQPAIRKDNAHWHPLFNSFGSPLGDPGYLITDIGGGSFRIDAQESTYGPWDEYLMGLRTAASTPNSFRVTGANPAPPYNVGDTFTGTRNNVTINQLIANEGARVPGTALAQKVFHVGVCLVVPDTSVLTADLNEAVTFMGQMANFFRDETEERGYLTAQTCPVIYTTPVTDIDVGGSPCESAMLPDGSKLYVPNLFDDTVSVIDTDDTSPSFHTVIDTIPVGDRPTAVAVRGDGNRVYVTSQTDSQLTVIDPATDMVIGTIGTGLGSSQMAVGLNGPAANRGYVLNTDDDEITVINLSTGSATGTISTGNQGGTFRNTDIVVSPDGEVLVWANRADDTVTARGLVNGNETTLATGDAPTSISIVQLESNPHNTVARAQASTSPPALVYVSASFDDHVRVFDLVTNPTTNAFTFRRLPVNPDAGGATVPDIATGVDPLDLEFSPGGSVCLVPTRNVDAFDVIVPATHTVFGSVSLPGGSLPIDVVYSRDGRLAYIIEEGSNQVSVFR